MLTSAVQGVNTGDADRAPLEHPLVDRPGAYYALGILSIVTFFSLLDRQLIAIIVGPLKQEFGLSDTMFSMLQGYSFALPYALLGLPLGRMVDRYNRRNLVFCGLMAWSLLTIASGFAQNFSQLVIFRAGVGIGEAVLAPAAYSLIADYFRPSRCGRAVSFYYLSMAIGAGGSIILGGLLLQWIPPSGVVIGNLIALTPWRMLFVLTGLPGLFAGLLVLSMREPPRGIAHHERRATFGELTAFLWTSRAKLWRISALSVMITLAGISSASWAPALFDRQFGIPPSQTAMPIGLATIAGSVLGPIISGWLSDRWTSRGLSNSRVRVMPIGYLLLLPAGFWCLMPSLWLAIPLFMIVVLSASIVQSAMPLAFMEATPVHMRGQVIALQLMILGLLSIGLGPTLVALVTDHVYHSDAMLRWSIFTVMMPLSIIGLGLCIESYARFRQPDNVDSV